MLPGSGRDGRRRPGRGPRMTGLRTTWTDAGEGEFFCPGCGGDRNYRRMRGQVRLTVLGVPLLDRGETGPVVECAACGGRFGAEVLDHPTTARFSAMLRDAVHTVALAVL
ncbi:TerB family tellurite resistance protein, partial [Streptomyces sp. UH6]|nr:TerB family tellurite resistance protein [Streptomyces sp. UH6]